MFIEGASEVHVQMLFVVQRQADDTTREPEVVQMVRVDGGKRCLVEISCLYRVKPSVNTITNPSAEREVKLLGPEILSQGYLKEPKHSVLRKSRVMQGRIQGVERVTSHSPF